MRVYIQIWRKAQGRWCTWGTIATEERAVSLQQQMEYVHGIACRITDRLDVST